MAEMKVYYATRDGQSRRIAEHIAGRLRARGIETVSHDVSVDIPNSEAFRKLPVCVLIAAVRYGRHLAAAERFIDAYKATSAPPPLVLASVNLTARKPGKDTPEGNAYLRKLIKRRALAPALALPIAGRLDYQRYSFRDRQIIRFIMWLTGGPTNSTACVEYTDWKAVDGFANRIAELCGAAPASAP